MRHFVLPGDHLWTGEGARFSWSMRLRGKVCAYEIQGRNGKWIRAPMGGLSFWQKSQLDDPFIFHRYVQTVLCPQEGQVFARIYCKAISRTTALLLDPTQDLCQVEYSFAHHNGWISPEPGSWDPKYLSWFENHRKIVRRSSSL